MKPSDIVTLGIGVATGSAVTDMLDWNRLLSGDYRALNPDHQPAFDALAAPKKEVHK